MVIHMHVMDCWRLWVLNTMWRLDSSLGFLDNVCFYWNKFYLFFSIFFIVIISEPLWTLPFTLGYFSDLHRSAKKKNTSSCPPVYGFSDSILHVLSLQYKYFYLWLPLIHSSISFSLWRVFSRNINVQLEPVPISQVHPVKRIIITLSRQ